MIRQNLHTHSIYVDGKDTIEEMIETAIEKGFTKLGFSEHAYLEEDDVCMTQETTEQYIEEVRFFQQKYCDQIEIFLGLEQDMFYRDPHPEMYDYIIGSGHYLRKDLQVNSVDNTTDHTDFMLANWFEDDFLKYADAYYSQLKEMASWDEVDIIAHLDLLMKFNDDQHYISFEDPKYVKIACDTIDALSHKIFEVNTGAISRGYRSLPYPHKNLLEYMKAKDVKLVLNSDCHNRFDLDCYFPQALDLIKSCGYKKLMTITQEGFVEENIEEFE